ncbi:MAG: hypothetical protein U5J83_16740 [Bryobacterales bacterium]|nr:hypothetical protein [Bryobacterales bacterium]
MPFIRYDLGDLCRMRLDDCPCGRSTRRIDPPIGRNADMITLPDGKKASCALLDVALRDLSGLVQYRFVQTGLTTSSRLNSFFDASPGAERLGELREHISALLANAFEITIEQMPCYRTDGQKFKVFVSDSSARSPRQPCDHRETL